MGNLVDDKSSFNVVSIHKCLLKAIPADKRKNNMIKEGERNRRKKISKMTIYM